MSRPRPRSRLTGITELLGSGLLVLGLGDRGDGIELALDEVRGPGCYQLTFP
jgi:hypothetical protein